MSTLQAALSLASGWFVEPLPVLPLFGVDPSTVLLPPFKLDKNQLLVQASIPDQNVNYETTEGIPFLGNYITYLPHMVSLLRNFENLPDDVMRKKIEELFFCIEHKTPQLQLVVPQEDLYSFWLVMQDEAGFSDSRGNDQPWLFSKVDSLNIALCKQDCLYFLLNIEGYHPISVEVIDPRCTFVGREYIFKSLTDDNDWLCVTMRSGTIHEVTIEFDEEIARNWDEYLERDKPFNCYPRFDQITTGELSYIASKTTKEEDEEGHGNTFSLHIANSQSGPFLIGEVGMNYNSFSKFIPLE